MAGLSGSTALIPTHPTTSNYVQAWTQNSFGHYFFNSLFVAIATVVITVTFAALAAFAFARYSFPLKEFIFYAFLAAPGRARRCCSSSPSTCCSNGCT